MKILHIIDSGGIYGAENMLLNLAREQMALGHEVVLASIGIPNEGRKPIEQAAIDLGISLQTFRMLPGFNPAGICAILRYVRSNGIDILHSHGYKGDILLGLVPAWLRKAPLVTTLHGWTSTNHFSKIMLYEMMDRFVLPRIDGVVLVNRSMALPRRLKQRIGDRLHVIDNGITVTEETNRRMRQDLLRFCRRKPTIGAIGRLSAEKGFHILITACQHLLQEGTDIQLLILGEGEERSPLERLIASTPEWSDRFLLPGFVEGASSYLTHFDLLAMPSLTEGLPITLLEAMRAQTPIVATAVGGIPDMLKDGESALLVPSQDPARLADAIGKLLGDPSLRQRLCRAAYRKFLDRFTSQQMASRYQELYQTLC